MLNYSEIAKPIRLLETPRSLSEHILNANVKIYLAKPQSGAPGLFILTGCRISENKRLWNCPPYGFPGYCLIM